MRSGVASGKQLAFKINHFAKHGSIKALIAEDLKQDKDANPGDVVEGNLDFVRQWVGYLFPSSLMVIDSIQEHVFKKHGLGVGNYRFYASQMENYFMPPGIAALDEYGLPVQLGLRLKDLLGGGGDLDAALEHLQKIEIAELELHPFERDLLTDVQSSI